MFIDKNTQWATNYVYDKWIINSIQSKFEKFGNTDPSFLYKYKTAWIIRLKWKNIKGNLSSHVSECIGMYYQTLVLIHVAFYFREKI